MLVEWGYQLAPSEMPDEGKFRKLFREIMIDRVEDETWRSGTHIDFSVFTSQPGDLGI